MTKTFYIPTALTAKPFDSTAWTAVKDGDTLAETTRQTREDAFADYERLDLRQMYDIIDAAPAWDCVDGDFYDTMCELAGLNPDEYEDAEALMAAVEQRLSVQDED